MKSIIRIRFELYIAIITVVVVSFLYSQVPPIGGPYEPDSNTVLLMHFDGDLTNESEFSADGVEHGAPGALYFIPNTGLGLGQCLRIDNDSDIDTAYITVADTPALDLTGDWTIEGWINIFTFGETSDDWRWVPRLIIKTGDEVFWRPNYFIEMWGSDRFFSCGYQAASQDAWPQVNSASNILVPGSWFHITFIRDTSRQILIQMTHNADRELVVFNVADYTKFGAADVTPITTDQPIHIGFAGGGGDSYLDGFVDEIRVSNIVREVPTPPIVSYVTKLENSFDPSTDYEIKANIYTLFEGPILETVELQYSTDRGENWTALDMTPTETDTFVASIPSHPVGTVFYYRVHAVDDQGNEFTGVPPEGLQAVPYYSFGISQANTKTLYLDFEEGSGVPTDASIFNHTVTVEGNPTYSTDAAVGNYSIYLEGDSSYLEIDSPFLASRQFTVDFWFNADTMIEYTRLINRPIASDNWYQNNYQIRFEPDNGILAGYWSENGDIYWTLVLDSTLQVGTWYHVKYQVSPDTALFQLFDINNQLIDQKSHVVFAAIPPVLATAPLRIGHAAGRPYFSGRMDDIKIYNYTTDLLATDPWEETGIPTQFELSQNYPNPFNPTTKIQFITPKKQKITLIVYDLLGKKIITLMDKEVVAGKYTVTWDGRNELNYPVASGVYLYQLKTDNFMKVRKMVFLK